MSRFVRFESTEGKEIAVNAVLVTVVEADDSGEGTRIFFGQSQAPLVKAPLSEVVAKLVAA